MKSNKIFFLLPLLLLLFGCGGGGGGGGSKTLVSIAVTPANTSIANGTTQQFTATGTFSDNSMQDISSAVTWKSSNTGVATISAAGLATSVAVGITTITAASGTITSNSASLTVTTAALRSITVKPANPIINIGATQQFTATGTFSDNSTNDLTSQVTWSSSNATVATIVSTTGVATAAAAGNATITATAPASLGSISGATTLTVTVPAGTGAANVLSITVNGSLCSSAFNASYPNKPCVSVTVCTPGTSVCQTVNDILLDTGSTGLRIFKQALSTPLNQIAVSSGALAECAQFVDGSSEWGPVQSAAVVLGGEPAVTVPILVMDSTFGTVPASCGTPAASPADAQLNGILGVGLFTEDCGPTCVTGANNGMYFACTGASCNGTTVPLASQVQNPVVHLPVDNNGVLVQLPAVPPGGTASASGQLVLGIGTQSNNTLSGVTAFPTNASGDFTTIFNGTALNNSFIDSGSNGLFFNDPLIPLSPSGWYIPSSTTTLSATTRGATGSPSATVTFQIGNANTLFGSGNDVFIELGGSLPGVSGFDWGLPFFLGRNVFVGIEGKSSNLGAGPYWAY
ncbi:MAG TPA: DUF3443 family protein [Geobacteraceae bacterium]